MRERVKIVTVGNNVVILDKVPSRSSNFPSMQTKEAFVVL